MKQLNNLKESIQIRVPDLWWEHVINTLLILYDGVTESIELMQGDTDNVF